MGHLASVQLELEYREMDESEQRIEENEKKNEKESSTPVP